jgi:HK97 family phage prohead protease
MITTALARRADAAAKRAHEVRSLADRPSKRRNDESPAAPARVAATLKNLRVDEPSTSGIVRFDGYASITERAYEMWDWYGPYDEIVRTGAFAQTLALADLDVPFVLGHDQMRRIARTTLGTLILTEDSEGLRVQADLDTRDVDVAYIVPKLRAGLIDEMSFAFRIIKGTWSPDWDQYYIEQVDLHRGDVAIVGYGANPFTAGSGLSEGADDDERTAPAPIVSPTRKRGVDLISEADIAPRRA